MTRKLTQEEVVLQFKQVHGDNYNYEKVSYVSAKHKVSIYCKKCEEYFEQTPNSHKQGHGCPFCAGNKVNNKNSIATIRPDLIKYFIDEKEANNYTISSGKEMLFKCPNCNSSKKMVIKTLNREGYSCPNCSDGLSIPEKFCSNLLSQLKVNYEKEKIFKWSDNKRYDFYLEDLSTIIEVHGEQHFKETNRKGKSLIKEQENDILKKKNAMKNGIEKYISIDCSKSDFDFLREKFTEAFEKMFDLSNIEWDNIWENSQKSIIIDVWDSWNNRKESDTIKDLAKKFKISTATFTRYLVKGKVIDRCKYSPNEHNRKILSYGKTIQQFTLDNIFIQEYNSIEQASKNTKTNKVGISNCCHNKQKTSGGFRWRFKEI